MKTTNRSLRVSVTNTELSAGSIVQGRVHLDPSLVTLTDTLRLELVGREVAAVGRQQPFLQEQPQRRRLYKEAYVFLRRQSTWTAQDVLTKRDALFPALQQQQQQQDDDDDDASSTLTWDFSMALPNDLPPTFSEDIPEQYAAVNDPSSRCQVEYSLQATYGEDCASEPCFLRMRRLIHQALTDVVSLQISQVLERVQPMLCGLYEQTQQTFVLSTTTTTGSELVWSPLQQSAVTIRLTDPRDLLPPTTALSYHRLEVRLVQRVVWHARDHAILPLERTWTLEPRLYFQPQLCNNNNKNSSNNIPLVDGEVVLPSSVWRESYEGRLIHVQHFVVFSLHQRKAVVVSGNHGKEWTLVGTSPQIPVRIER